MVPQTSLKLLILSTILCLTYGSVSNYDPILLDAILRNPDLIDAVANLPQDHQSVQQLADADPYNYFGSDVNEPNMEPMAIRSQQPSPFRSLNLDANSNTDSMSEKLTMKTLKPTIRDQESIQHSSSLWGHQHMTGGAGEGDQFLKPDGSLSNVQVIKSDAILPAYCDPPNPCPLGMDPSMYDCINVDTFTNSAAFSREYQNSQDCMCDAEHMFDCPAPTPGAPVSMRGSSGSSSNFGADDENNDDKDLDTLARTLANNGDIRAFMGVEGGDGNDKRARLIVDADHRVVAKKYFFSDEQKREHLNELKDQTNDAWRSKVKRSKVSRRADSEDWLSGERTPFVMAKKSPEMF